MKKEEKGSSRRRYDDNDNNNNDNNDVDMDGRGREAEGEGERWWNNHRCMQHGQHPRVPTGNYDGGYDNEDIPVIPALDLGNAANHFLALAVLMLAFLLLSSLLLLSSSLRMATATAVASWRGDWGFVAVLGMRMMASNKNVDNNDVMTRIQATARLLSLSCPTPEARGAIITTWIAMTRTMHAAAAARIKGETTRALKIVGGTTRGTSITTQRHATTNKRRVQQEVEPPSERWREATGNATTNQTRGAWWNGKRWMCQLKVLARQRGQQI
jgi:hypothetical protein